MTKAQFTINDLLKTHFDIEEILGVVVKDTEDTLLAETHLQLLHDHANQPLLLLGRHVAQHMLQALLHTFKQEKRLKSTNMQEGIKAPETVFMKLY